MNIIFMASDILLHIELEKEKSLYNYINYIININFKTFTFLFKRQLKIIKDVKFI